MGQIQLLDCTLRDGGYINEWNFGEEAVRGITSGLNQAGVEIIECGFLSPDFSRPGRTRFPNTNHIGPEVQKGKARLAAMIAIGEQELDPAQLCEKTDSPVDIIRLTFHEEEIEKAVRYGKEIQKKGYQLFMQPVGTALYSDRSLTALLEEMNQMRPEAFYLVDTSGTMYPADVERMLYLVDHNLIPQICVGFHSHNNLQLSFSNAQQFISFQTARSRIVDCAVFGMGRGAGNLCTELIADYLNKTFGERYDILPLLEIIDTTLSPIFARAPWGYSAAYFLAASYCCHPNYASWLLAKQTLPVSAIAAILSRIPASRRGLFHRQLIERLYEESQNGSRLSENGPGWLRRQIGTREVLILGSGPSIQQAAETLRREIQKRSPFTIAVNCIPPFSCDLFFISNRKRYHLLKNRIQNVPVLFTSNMGEALPEDAVIADYESLVEKEEAAGDNSGMMLLRLLGRIGITSVSVAGFDGYHRNQVGNYFDEEFVGVSDSYELQRQNLSITTQLSQIKKTMRILFLTPTLYRTNIQDGEKAI